MIQDCPELVGVLEINQRSTHGGCNVVRGECWVEDMNPAVLLGFMSALDVLDVLSGSLCKI